MVKSSPSSPIENLNRHREQLIGRFLEGKELDFFQRNAEIIDHYFQEAFANSSVGPGMHVEKYPYAIIALGGYGRKVQHIFSDVDVLILFKKRISDKARELVQEIIYPLWDTGLEVGHATRTIKECRSLAAQDYEVLTSLLDGRFICGISSLYSDLNENLRRKILQKHGRKYTQWLTERNAIRHERFGDSTYLLEPNLKQGLGGLRDFHAMLWAGRAVFEFTTAKDLKYQGHMTHEEFEALEKALNFIRTVRNWLHYVTNRACDQLYFEHQIRLAHALGFEDLGGQQAVERFLSMLHKKMEYVKRQHLIFFEKISKAKRKKKSPARRPLSTGLELGEGTLHFTTPESILENPKILIKIFEKSAVLKKPLCDQASRLVREFLYLVDDKYRVSPPVIKSLKRILSAPTHSFNVLYEMLNTGLLAALVPEIKGIVDRIQYDEYHLYPVDKHSLRTVQILKDLRDADPKGHLAFYATVYRELDDPEPLLWAGLFHDIGKGGSQEKLDQHAEKGAVIVEQAFTRMGFAQQKIDLIAALVREHLFLIHIATRRDIHDEETIVQCARRIGDEKRLQMLYLLTVADCMATGPKAWNDWKAALLKELYFKIYHILQEGDLGSPASDKVVKTKRQQVLDTVTSIPEEKLDTLFNQLSPRYLLYTPTTEIVRHIALFQTLGDQPSVLVAGKEPGTRFRTITICAKDFPGLFAKIAGVFTLHGLNILSAQIYTWRNQIALDIFKVDEPLDTLREKEKWDRVDRDLKAVLNKTLSLPEALHQKFPTKQVRRGKLWIKDRIVIDNQTSDFFSIIEIYTHDRPGLLYHITETLFRCALDIWIARIGTKADQVVDVFYVRDIYGQKILPGQQMATVKKAIEEVLAGKSDDTKSEGVS